MNKKVLPLVNPTGNQSLQAQVRKAANCSHYKRAGCVSKRQPVYNLQVLFQNYACMS